MTDTKPISDYEQIEKNILSEIKALKRDKTPNFLDTLEKKYIDLYDIRCIILNNEYIKLPKNQVSFRSPQEEHYYIVQYYNYYHKYNMILASHPVFYDFSKITEKRKIFNEINVINNRLQLIMNKINKLEQIMAISK